MPGRGVPGSENLNLEVERMEMEHKRLGEEWRTLENERAELLFKLQSRDQEVLELVIGIIGISIYILSCI